MKVLIACEYSGIVRDAFLKRGHDAISCDLLPTELTGPHYQGDVFDIINDGFDMMIAHPPCTYISYASTRVWNNPGRCKKRLEALDFFRKLWEAPIEKICLENPKSCASPVIAKYSQEIQPYYFGDNAMKKTWLWLKNLPRLIHIQDDDLFFKKTHIETPETTKLANWYNKGGKDRQKNRAKFWPGIAKAMAEQWG